MIIHPLLSEYYLRILFIRKKNLTERKILICNFYNSKYIA